MGLAEEVDVLEEEVDDVDVDDVLVEDVEETQLVWKNCWLTRSRVM